MAPRSLVIRDKRSLRLLFQAHYFWTICHGMCSISSWCPHTAAQQGRLYAGGTCFHRCFALKLNPKGKMNSCCKGAAVGKPQDGSFVVHVVKPRLQSLGWESKLTDHQVLLSRSLFVKRQIGARCTITMFWYKAFFKNDYSAAAAARHCCFTPLHRVRWCFCSYWARWLKMWACLNGQHRLFSGSHKYVRNKDFHHSECTGNSSRDVCKQQHCSSLLQQLQSTCFSPIVPSANTGNVS